MSFVCGAEKNRFLFSLYLYLTILSFPVLVFAVEHGAFENETEDEFFSEIPSVISATRIRQPLTEVPSSVTVIDRNMIEASGAIELADIFRLVPGMQVAYPQGNQIAVAYHGFSDAFPRNMQILVDGRSVYQPSLGDVDWLFIGVALDDIDRIEVVRGPNSAFYGSNAVQGVINIITTQPYQNPGIHTRFTAGSLDTLNGVVRYAGNEGKLDYRLTGTYEQANGLPGELDSTDDGRKVGGLSFRGVLQQSLNDEVDIQIGLNSGVLGAGAELPDDPLAHDKDVSSDYQYINWRHTFSSGADSQLQFYRNAYKTVDDYPQLLSEALNVTPETVEYLLEGRPDQVVELGLYNYEGQRYDLEWQYTSPRKGQWRSMLGAGLRLNQLKSAVLTDQQDWIKETSGRVFANIDYRPIESIIAGLGVIAEDSNEFGSFISPRVSLNYLISAEHSLRVSYTQAQRNPSLVEANFNRKIKLNDGTDVLVVFRSLDPQSETKTSTEIGFVGYWMERNLLLDLKLFNERTENVIHEMRSLEPQPFPRFDKDMFVYGNDGTLEVNGFEMQLKYQLGPKDFISFQYANMDVKSSLRLRIDSAELWEKPSISVPKDTVSALFNHAFSKGYEGSIGYYSLSEMTWLGDGDFSSGYQRWDFRLAKQWLIKSARHKAEIIVQNAGGDYPTFRDANIFETRIFLRLTSDF